MTFGPSSQTFCLPPGDSPCRFALTPVRSRSSRGKPGDSRKPARLPSHCSPLAPPALPRSGGNGGPGLPPASSRGDAGPPGRGGRQSGRQGSAGRRGPGLEPVRRRLDRRLGGRKFSGGGEPLRPERQANRQEGYRAPCRNPCF